MERYFLRRWTEPQFLGVPTEKLIEYGGKFRLVMKRQSDGKDPMLLSFGYKKVVMTYADPRKVLPLFNLETMRLLFTLASCLIRHAQETKQTSLA